MLLLLQLKYCMQVKYAFSLNIFLNLFLIFISIKDKESTTCVFDFFHSLIEYEMNIVTPYLTDLIGHVLKVCFN